jgi:molybdopterin converting factor small subunit
MAAATSEVTLELHGALADRFAALGTRRGTRTRIEIGLESAVAVGDLLRALVAKDERYTHLFDTATGRLPEHVEAVLNDRVLELQGGVQASVKPGDVLTFIPAHAGG